MSVQHNHRHSEQAIHPQFLARWSPRAFLDEPLPVETLRTFVAAARWAPSAYNHQPWRFLYALRPSAQWDAWLDVLLPFNQQWVLQASAMVAVVSRTTALPPGAEQPVPNATHAFDTGAAWGALALQASLSGWQAHGMTGFDAARAREVLALPEDHALHAMVAIGRPGDPATLPEALRAREQPSDRRPLDEFLWEGHFPSA